MSERASGQETVRDDVAAGGTERRGRDGVAGAGDMLGGIGAGAGDRLGVDDPAEGETFEPGPISGHQHALDEGEPRTDSATTVHSAANLPAEGA